MTSKTEDCVVGFDIGGTHFRSALFTKNSLNDQMLSARPSLEDSFEHPKQQSPEDLVAKIVSTLNDFENQSNGSISHAGVGLAAWIDNESSRVIKSPHLKIRDVDMLGMLKKKRPNTTFKLLNDLNAIVLGEHQCGAGIGINNLIAVYFGTGVGAGFILNGQLYTGQGLAGELGHINLGFQFSHYPCDCGGHGCLESVSGGKRLLERITKKWSADSELADDSNIKNQRVNGLSIDHAYRQGNSIAMNEMDLSIAAATASISNLLIVIDPEMIVLGGGLLDNCPLFKEKMFRDLKSKHPHIKIVSPGLKKHAGLIGSALFSMQENL